MSLQVEKLEKNMAKLTIEASAEEFEAAVEKAYQKAKKSISLPGFRKGKAPRRMIEKMYGTGVFYEDAANDLIPDAYSKALDECEEQIVSQPKIDVVQIESGKPFIFTAEVALKPEVTLGEYKGVEVETVPVEVTDAEIDAEVDKQREQNARTIDIDDRAVEKGDMVKLDFDGSIDGVPFDGGKSENYDLTIGSGSFIPGFEDQLVGVKIGDTVDLTLTFPESYPSEELAGKETVFTVTVNSVKRMKELTSDLVSTITDGEYTDVDAYKESVKETLIKNKEDSRDSEIKSDILSQISANSTIKDYPQEMLDYGLTNMQNAYKQMASQYDMEYADLLQNYFGMTEEQFNEEALNVVKQNLDAEMYLKAIAEKEGIEVSNDDYEAACQRYADTYGYDSVDDLKAAYDEDTIRISALQDKVLDFLEENTTVEETTETEASTEAAEEETAEAGTEAGTEAQTEAAEDGTEAATEASTEAATEASTEAAE